MIILIFILGATGTEQNVSQFQYLGWSDYEAPSSMSSIFLLIKEIRKIISEKGSNINVLVHCSTGTGRSGTFVALYYLMEMLDQKMAHYKQFQETSGSKKLKQQDLEIDVFNTLFSLSKQRCEMVSVYYRQYPNFYPYNFYNVYWRLITQTT